MNNLDFCYVFITHVLFYYVLLKKALQLLMLRKSNRIWVDKGNEFYSRSMKSFLQNNDIEMYSMHNEGKSVYTEKFIRALQDKIYKYLTSVSKNVHIDKLDNIVNKYNNTQNSATKVKPFNVKSKQVINSSKEINDKDPKFKTGNKKHFRKGYLPYWFNEMFMIKKIKNTVPWRYVISDLKSEEIG